MRKPCMRRKPDHKVETLTGTAKLDITRLKFRKRCNKIKAKC